MSGISRRGALGVGALLGLPFAGHLADADHGDTDDDHAADAGMAYRLDALRGDGAVVVAQSPAPLEGLRAALADAGFRTDVQTSPPAVGAEPARWHSDPAPVRRRRKRHT
jgi:hypothetical protein